MSTLALLRGTMKYLQLSQATQAHVLEIYATSRSQAHAHPEPLTLAERFACCLFLSVSFRETHNMKWKHFLIAAGALTKGEYTEKTQIYIRRLWCICIEVVLPQVIARLALPSVWDLLVAADTKIGRAHV